MSLMGQRVGQRVGHRTLHVLLVSVRYQVQVNMLQLFSSNKPVFLPYEISSHLQACRNPQFIPVLGPKTILISPSAESTWVWGKHDLIFARLGQTWWTLQRGSELFSWCLVGFFSDGCVDRKESYLSGMKSCHHKYLTFDI